MSANALTKKNIGRQATARPAHFLEQEEELTNLQEQRNVQMKKMAETEENIKYFKKQSAQYLAEFDRNLAQELTESSEKLESYRQELIKYQQALKRTVVKAPVSGYVQQLAYHTHGGVVEAAKPIMNLVPENYKLEAEVMILNQDIGFVRPNQPVEIKIDSFPFTKYGTVKAKVRQISEDAVQDEKLGLIFCRTPDSQRQHHPRRRQKPYGSNRG